MRAIGIGGLVSLALGAWLIGSSQAAQPAESEGGKMDRAIFAGGCFWCMQPAFDRLEGVIETRVGFSGGQEKNPTYEQVSSGRTGHTEAIEVVYDPTKVSYQKLLEVYWRSFDPTDLSGQFADRGPQYRPVIFAQTPEQQRLAEESRQALEASGRFDHPILVPIEPAGHFWPAEGYHQKYYQKNPSHYKAYQQGSGRAGFLKLTWDKADQ